MHFYEPLYITKISIIQDPNTTTSLHQYNAFKRAVFDRLSTTDSPSSPSSSVPVATTPTTHTTTITVPTDADADASFPLLPELEFIPYTLLLDDETKGSKYVGLGKTMSHYIHNISTAKGGGLRPSGSNLNWILDVSAFYHTTTTATMSDDTVSLKKRKLDQMTEPTSSTLRSDTNQFKHIKAASGTNGSLEVLQAHCGVVLGAKVSDAPKQTDPNKPFRYSSRLSRRHLSDLFCTAIYTSTSKPHISPTPSPGHSVDLTVIDNQIYTSDSTTGRKSYAQWKLDNTSYTTVLTAFKTLPSFNQWDSGPRVDGSASRASFPVTPMAHYRVGGA